MSRLNLFPLLLLCVFVALVDGFVTCDACYSVWQRCFCSSCWFIQRCAPRANRHEEVRSALIGSLYGQDQAISLIGAALRRFDGGGPLSMHFVGDNGVGKTFAATLLANAMFESRGPAGDAHGFLYLRGEHFSGSNVTLQARFRRQIADSVVKTLTACPHALIVLDEVEKVHYNTVRVLHDFLDGTNPLVVFEERKVRTDRAVFVLISDFHRAGVTLGMTLPELAAAVDAESRKIWRSEKASAVIDTIVPFRALQRPAMTQMMQDRFEAFLESRACREARITELNVDSRCLAQLVSFAMEKHAGMNGRAIGRVFDQYVADALFAAIDLNRETTASTITTSWRSILYSFLGLQRQDDVDSKEKKDTLFNEYTLHVELEPHAPTHQLQVAAFLKGKKPQPKKIEL